MDTRPDRGSAPNLTFLPPPPPQLPPHPSGIIFLPSCCRSIQRLFSSPFSSPAYLCPLPLPSTVPQKATTVVMSLRNSRQGDTTPPGPTLQASRPAERGGRGTATGAGSRGGGGGGFAGKESGADGEPLRRSILVELSLVRGCASCKLHISP